MSLEKDYTYALELNDSFNQWYEAGIWWKCGLEYSSKPKEDSIFIKKWFGQLLY